MAHWSAIAHPLPVPEWVATCPTCGGPVRCGIEEWESETGIVTPGGLYVECAADAPEGAIEWRTGDWDPVRQRVLAWARVALRMGDAGVRPATGAPAAAGREVWRVMAETSTIRQGLTPWGSLSLAKFLREAAAQTRGSAGGTAKRAVLGVSERPDVASRQWWVLWWVGEDGRPHEVEASSLALLVERAAAVELGVRDAAEREWGDQGAEEGGGDSPSGTS